MKAERMREKDEKIAAINAKRDALGAEFDELMAAQNAALHPPVDRSDLEAADKLRAQRISELVTFTLSHADEIPGLFGEYTKEWRKEYLAADAAARAALESYTMQMNDRLLAGRPSERRMEILAELRSLAAEVMKVIES